MEHIIKSLIDVDFYKFTMGQLIWKKWRDVPVRFSFKNRTKSVVLTKYIPENRLRHELDAVRSLWFSKPELDYLRNVRNCGMQMFSEEYLHFLEYLVLPAYELSYGRDEFKLEFAGDWSEVTYWETLALSVVNELYYQSILSNLPELERERVQTEGQKRLGQKIETLRSNPAVGFSDFGTRRRFGREWQDCVVDTLATKLPGQFRGTSNILLAMKHNLHPIGTNAHEMQMVLAGIQKTDAGMLDSQNQFLKAWFDEYGEALSIFLPDTFGSDFFLRKLPKEFAEKWKGFRHDSGQPLEFAEKIIAYYKSLGIDPKEKLIVFSDGLELPVILELHNHLKERIAITFGWGTNLTNDLGFAPLSLVVKATEASGSPLVKLSDNIAKAVGEQNEIKRYVELFEYEVSYSKDCLY